MAYKEQEVNVNALDINRGSGGREFVNHKIKDGDNIFRILPPFGTKANGRVTAEYWLSWGFTDSEGNKKPLVSTLGIDHECPIFEATQELSADMADLVREYSYEDGGKTKVDWKKVPQELKDKYQELKANRDAIRPSRGFFYNALDQSGTVGILRLPKTAAEQLNAKIKDAIKRLGLNPVSLREGCSFNIHRKRTGSRAFDVEYSVDLLKTASKDASGNPTETIQKSSVPEDLIENFDKRAYDLFSLYRYRTPADLRKILSGDTSIFDREAEETKFRKGESSKTTTAMSEADSSEISVASTPTTPTTPTAAQPVVSVATETTTTKAPPATPLTEDSTDERVAELAKKLNLS